MYYNLSNKTREVTSQRGRRRRSRRRGGRGGRPAWLLMCTGAPSCVSAILCSDWHEILHRIYLMRVFLSGECDNALPLPLSTLSLPLLLCFVLFSIIFYSSLSLFIYFSRPVSSLQVLSLSCRHLKSSKLSRSSVTSLPSSHFLYVHFYSPFHQPSHLECLSCPGRVLRSAALVSAPSSVPSGAVVTAGSGAQRLPHRTVGGNGQQADSQGC